MGEKTAATKNNDCYFYYYSSCSKGASCPFRHEPAALRNETMCIYWLQGNCNKANCIFRHMEITKPRDKIACWFESQPGGCKKPHCPFQHQNILDHPREEDIKKNPDLILPVKKEEEKAEAESQDVVSVECERTVILPTPAVEQETAAFSRQLQFAAITSDPIIVPLQDGESDSESVSGSPQKKVESGLRLSAQREWELRRLRQIQAHEADLIGYTLEEDQEEQQEKKPVKIVEEEEEEEEEDPEEFVVEEVVEIEDANDTAHRPLSPPANDLRSRLAARPFQNPEDEEDLRHSLLKNRGNSRTGESRPRKRLPMSERLGGVAGRALAETLGKASLRKPLKRLTNKDNSESVNAKSVTQRLVGQTGDNKSLANRLSSRLGQDLRGIIPDQGSSLEDKPSPSRAGNKKGQQVDTLEDPSTCMKSSPEANIKKRLSKNNSGKGEPLDFDFTVKSLADIRAEKQKKWPTKTVQTSDGTKSETKSHPSQARETKPAKCEGEVKVLTLAEIRASKRQAPLTTFSGSGALNREPSPVSLSQNPAKKFKSECKETDSSQSTIFNSNALSIEPLEQRATFSTRKIAINRSAVKVPECTSQSHQELPAVRIAESATVQVKKSPTKTCNAVVQEKSLGSNDKANGNVSNSSPPAVAPSNVHSQVANTKSIPSSHNPLLKRFDSLLDEEEAQLLEGDMLELEDDDEDQLLL